jgi:hypothetical protein
MNIYGIIHSVAFSSPQALLKEHCTVTISAVTFSEQLLSCCITRTRRKHFRTVAVYWILPSNDICLQACAAAYPYPEKLRLLGCYAVWLL